MPQKGETKLKLVVIDGQGGGFGRAIIEALRAKGERVGADRQVSKPDLPRLNKIIKELITEKFGNRHLGG